MDDADAANLRIEATTNATLQSLRAREASIGPGTGICRSCCEPIEPERMSANPKARECRICAVDSEAEALRRRRIWASRPGRIPGPSHRSSWRRDSRRHDHHHSLLRSHRVRPQSPFVDKDEDHIINILFREARKFGVMVMLAAQEIGSFPQAVLSSSATKMILGIDDIYHRATEDRLGLERGKLKYIKPQQTAFVQCKRRAGDDQLGQGFYEIRLSG